MFNWVVDIFLSLVVVAGTPLCGSRASNMTSIKTIQWAARLAARFCFHETGIA